MRAPVFGAFETDRCFWHRLKTGHLEKPDVKKQKCCHPSPDM